MGPHWWVSAFTEPFRSPRAAHWSLCFQVNGCLLDPLPPAIIRKGSTSSPSNMMETSIDEGIETEEPDMEDDPAQVFIAFQTARFGQRRHTLSEVTNQPGVVTSAGQFDDVLAVIVGLPLKG